MEFTLLALYASVVKKFVDFVRMASHKDIKGVLTQLAAWMTGILAVYTAAQLNAPSIAGFDLSHAGLWLIALIGVAVGSVGSTVHDTLTAVDNYGASVDTNPGPENPVL